MALWEKSEVKPLTLRKEVVPVPMSTLSSWPSETEVGWEGRIFLEYMG